MLPGRQLPLNFGAGDVGSARARDARTARGAAHVLDGSGPPLVHSCISQQTPPPSLRASLLGVRFEVYRKSVRVVRPVAPMIGTRGGKRSAVDSFSEASRRRLRRVASECGDELVSQFCLTYQHSDPDGETVKRHLNVWLTWLRRRAPGVRYLWILEFQKRGVPHFHVFLNLQAGDAELHAEMARKWHAVTMEMDSAHLAFHLNQKNWMDWDMGSGAYVCKYLDKANQKNVPDYFGWVGRFWGASRGLMPKPCVYDTHEMRAMCGQNTENAYMEVTESTRHVTSNYTQTTRHVTSNYTRDEPVRDATALILRTLGNYQASQWRKYGRKGRHLSRGRSSRWIQGGADVMWRVVEKTLEGRYG